MTSKERLEQLVAELGEEEATRALELLSSSLLAGVPQPRSEPSAERILPAFVGSGEGAADLSERIDEVLDDGFGR